MRPALLILSLCLFLSGCTSKLTAPTRAKDAYILKTAFIFPADLSPTNVFNKGSLEPERELNRAMEKAMAGAAAQEGATDKTKFAAAGAVIHNPADLAEWRLYRAAVYVATRGMIVPDGREPTEREILLWNLYTGDLVADDYAMLLLAGREADARAYWDRLNEKLRKPAADTVMWTVLYTTILLDVSRPEHLRWADRAGTTTAQGSKSPSLKPYLLRSLRGESGETLMKEYNVELSNLPGNQLRTSQPNTD